MAQRLCAEWLTAFGMGGQIQDDSVNEHQAAMGLSAIS